MGSSLWKTNDPPSLKGVLNENVDSTRTLSFIRWSTKITALYLMIEGKIPPYYSKMITKDPRTLAYNLYTGELQYWKRSMQNDQCWVYVTDCMQSKMMK